MCAYMYMYTYIHAYIMYIYTCTLANDHKSIENLSGQLVATVCCIPCWALACSF